MIAFMVGKPQVFISAASADLRTARDGIVRDALLDIGCYPETEKHFQPDYRTVGKVLETKIRESQAVVQIIGFHEGSGPDQAHVPAALRGLSWTRMETALARKLGKPVYLILCAETFPFDAPTTPESADAQARQNAYRDEVCRGSQIWYQAANAEELRQVIHGLQVHVGLWRKAMKRGYGCVLAGVLGLIAILGLGAWQLDVLKRLAAKSAPVVERTQTRVENMEAKLDQVLAAQKQYEQERAPAQPSLAALPDGAYYEELTRRTGLTREQVELAVMAGTASASLPDQAKARMAARDFAGAEKLYLDSIAQRRADQARQALDLARNGQQAGQAALYQAEYPRAAQHLETALSDLQLGGGKALQPELWAGIQMDLASAWLVLSSRVEPAEGRKLLLQALSAYQSMADVYNRAAFPNEWGRIQNGLGNTYSEQGSRAEGAEAARLLEEAAAAYRQALEVRSREAVPSLWAVTQNNLGNVRQRQAKLGEGTPAQAAQQLRDAIAAYRAALEVTTREASPQFWAMILSNLGASLQYQGTLGEGPEAARLLSEAVVTYRQALEVRTREASPQGWATTMNNLGNALQEQGKFTEGAEARRLFDEAIAVYRQILEVRTREAVPQAWARTQYNLGNALYQKGLRSEGAEAARLLTEAVVAYEGALEVFTEKDAPAERGQVLERLESARQALGK